MMPIALVLSLTLLAPQEDAELQKSLQRALPSFVIVGGGSGVLISADGYLLTNHHVAGKGKEWRVFIGGKVHTADLVGSDPHGDLTLLKVRNAKDLPFVETADSDKLAIGQPVFAIGNPFGLAEDGIPTVTSGIISALHRFQGNYCDAIQTDAAVNPGNSGGPLLTLDGRLAGINGMIQTRFGARANTGIGLAIPANQIKRFLPFLKAAKGGHVFGGVIRGLEGDFAEADMMQNGAELRDVRAGSPAEKAGFRKGDRITQIDGARLLNFARFLGVLGTYPAGSELTVTLMRGTEPRTLKVKLEGRNPGSLGLSLARPRGIRDPATVDKIHPGLAAEKAGLRPGDALVGLNGKPAPTLREFVQTLLALQALAGDRIKLRVRRQETAAEEELDLVLNSAYDEPER